MTELTNEMRYQSDCWMIDLDLLTLMKHGNGYLQIKTTSYNAETIKEAGAVFIPCMYGCIVLTYSKRGGWQCLGVVQNTSEMAEQVQAENGFIRMPIAHAMDIVEAVARPSMIMQQYNGISLLQGLLWIKPLAKFAHCMGFNLHTQIVECDVIGNTEGQEARYKLSDVVFVQKAAVTDCNGAAIYHRDMLECTDGNGDVSIVEVRCVGTVLMIDCEMDDYNSVPLEWAFNHVNSAYESVKRISSSLESSDTETQEQILERVRGEFAG